MWDDLKRYSTRLGGLTPAQHREQLQRQYNQWISERVEAINLDPLTSREQAEHEEMECQDDWAEAQHRALLESYVKRIWDDTRYFGERTIGQRRLTHRLELVARHIHNVDRYGVKNQNEVDYQLDLLLTEWGAGKLIAYFGALAETEGQ